LAPFVENHGHSIVNRFDQPIRPGRDDREDSLPVAWFWLPRFVKLTTTLIAEFATMSFQYVLASVWRVWFDGFGIQPQGRESNSSTTVLAAERPGSNRYQNAIQN
jgi:hypothetical protein